jgi:type I restriction enzyme M protein
MLTAKELSDIYEKTHNVMRNVDGLQPQEAFDELLKYLFFKEMNEAYGPKLPRPEFSLRNDGGFAETRGQLLIQVRALFAKYLARVNSWAQQLWTDRAFKLSDRALFAVHEVYEAMHISDIPLDVRAAALREFVPPEIRRGLGIYLTPDDVVRMAVNIAAPKPGSKVLDPACGSGTFLIETIRYWRTKGQRQESIEVWGIDKNPRMLLLADLNLGHQKKIRFRKFLVDSLFDVPSLERATSTVLPNSFDYVFTNPPFGVYIDVSSRDAAKFDTCRGTEGRPLTRQQSELVFLEQCLRLLRPGGRLAIVLPKSVVTNVTERITMARRAIDSLGYVYGLVSLPPETFHTAGTQTTTFIAFLQKYQSDEERKESIQVVYAEVKNVGFDSTGRTRAGNEIPEITLDFSRTLNGGKPKRCRILSSVPKTESMSALSRLLYTQSRRSNRKAGVPLGDMVELVATGRTPARSNYTDTGLFVLKVGNLTGRGVDWASRERNFVDRSERDKRNRAGLMLLSHDIVLTSSAHSPVYIAKKIDIVGQIPPWVGGEASLVGEVMVIRARLELIDPYALLAFLRFSETREELRRMIRGQTAHLHPENVKELLVVPEIVQRSKKLETLVQSLKQEVALAFEMSKLAAFQSKAIAHTFGTSS